MRACPPSYRSISPSRTSPSQSVHPVSSVWRVGADGRRSKCGHPCQPPIRCRHRTQSWAICTQQQKFIFFRGEGGGRTGQQTEIDGKMVFEVEKVVCIWCIARRMDGQKMWVLLYQQTGGRKPIGQRCRNIETSMYVNASNNGRYALLFIHSLFFPHTNTERDHEIETQTYPPRPQELLPESESSERSVEKSAETSTVNDSESFSPSFSVGVSMFCPAL